MSRVLNEILENLHAMAEQCCKTTAASTMLFLGPQAKRSLLAVKKSLAPLHAHLWQNFACNCSSVLVH